MKADKIPEVYKQIDQDKDINLVKTPKVNSTTKSDDTISTEDV